MATAPGEWRRHMRWRTLPDEGCERTCSDVERIPHGPPDGEGCAGKGRMRHETSRGEPQGEGASERVTRNAPGLSGEGPTAALQFGDRSARAAQRTQALGRAAAQEHVEGSDPAYQRRAVPSSAWLGDSPPLHRCGGSKGRAMPGPTVPRLYRSACGLQGERRDRRAMDVACRRARMQRRTDGAATSCLDTRSDGVPLSGEPAG